MVDETSTSGIPKGPFRKGSLLKRSFSHVSGVVGGALQLVRRGPPIELGGLEKDEIVKLMGKENPVILDIGCNNGSQTLWFLSMFEDGHIYCFEPDPRACESFKAKVKDKRATLFNLAISDTDGRTEFFMSDGIPPSRDPNDYPQGWDASGSIRRPKKHLEKHPWCSFHKSITVDTKRLDSWFEEAGLDLIDFIWADVQGAEVDLIDGGRETLRHTRYLYTEYNNTELYEGQLGLRQLLRLLPEFEVVHRYPNDVLLRNKAMITT